MNKKMRNILAKIESKNLLVKKYTKGTNKDLKKAERLLDQIEELQKEYNIEARVHDAKMKNVDPDTKKQTGKKGNGFTMLSKMISKKMKQMTETEKAMIVDGTNGENNLLPEDIKLEINELRKQYKSAKELVTVVPTDALTGSVNYEKGEVVGLDDFSDGDDIPENGSPEFERKNFAIKFFGKLIPISRILMGAEKAGLMGYIQRWFLKNAVVTENKKIFDTLKDGKTKSVIKGWKALKKSINTDLDPDALYDAVIVTNQTGFAILDEEEDADGRPILKENPIDPTERLFQGLTIHVFSDRLLPNVSGKAPIFYGSLKAGCSFVEYENLEFAVSEHVFFGKNMTALRVIEGFDVMGTDKDTYIYGTFEATVTTP